MNSYTIYCYETNSFFPKKFYPPIQNGETAKLKTYVLALGIFDRVILLVGSTNIEHAYWMHEGEIGKELTNDEMEAWVLGL